MTGMLRDARLSYSLLLKRKKLGERIFDRLVISLLRFVVLALPLAWALSLTENAASLVWLSLPVAEARACLVAVLLTRKTYQKVV